MITFLAVFAVAQSAEPRGVAESRVPTCFPISDSVRILDIQQRLGSTPVFVEEHTTCTGLPVAPRPVVVPPDLKGRAALQFIVDALEAASRHAARYEVLDRSGGLYVAPVGVDRILDVPVDLGASDAATVYDARWRLHDQVRLVTEVCLYPLDDPRDTFSFAPNSVSLERTPLLTALQSLMSPHVDTVVGFTLEVEVPTDNPGARHEGCTGRATLERLVYAPPEEPEEMPVATPDTAWSAPRGE